MPPPTPKKSTSTGGTQTSPPKSNPHRQVDQGQPDCNEESQLANMTSNKGKKTKKLTSEAPPHPGPSTGPAVGPRNDFTSRNLGTGRPTIQCTACGEYSHWRRECPYIETMTMLHTCVGSTDRPTTTQVNKASRVHKYVSTVEVLERGYNPETPFNFSHQSSVMSTG